MTNRLSQNAFIIENKYFESFIAIVIGGQESMLYPQEKTSVQHLRPETGGAHISNDGRLGQTLNLARKVLRRSRTVDSMKEKSK